MSMMTTKIIKSRKPRKDCQYTGEERQSFDKHKKEYITQVTKEGREYVFQTQILPDIFNYWSQGGTVDIIEEEVTRRVKVCGGDERYQLILLLLL
jgi:hypothetical protein